MIQRVRKVKNHDDKSAAKPPTTSSASAGAGWGFDKEKRLEGD